MSLWQVGIWLVMAVIFGLIGQAVGKGKGQASAGWWLGFLLGIIGVIIIACLRPDREAQGGRSAAPVRDPGRGGPEGRVSVPAAAAVRALRASRPGGRTLGSRPASGSSLLLRDHGSSHPMVRGRAAAMTRAG